MLTLRNILASAVPSGRWWFVFWLVGVVVSLWVLFVLLFCVAWWQLNGLRVDSIQFSFVCTLSSWLMLPLHQFGEFAKCNCLFRLKTTWREPPDVGLFSVQRVRGFRQVVTQAFTCRKLNWYAWKATKRAGVDLYILERPFWAKPVLRRFSGPRIWVRRSKLFCRWFCFLLEQAGCISVAAWTRLKLASYDFVASGGLIVCCYKKAHQPFAALRWLLEVFLAVEKFVGFRAGGRLPFEWLYWILYCPLLAPLAPLDSYRSFPPRKNMNHDLFSQSRY